MNGIQKIQTNNKRDNRVFLLICCFACVPVYWASLFYIEVVTREEIEELAVAAIAGFFGSFYIGWLAAKTWVEKTDVQIRSSLAILGATSFVILLWLFIHADFQFHSLPAINLLLFWLPFILLGVTTGMSVMLVRISITQQLQNANITASQNKSELLLLQSQLSPHFLFNTLNNLYGLSLAQHEKVPPLLLKLSELLRYSVYDAKELFVPLKSELAYISNYIEFEKIRMGERLQLTTAVEQIDSDDLKIAPMLLIVFIENAFKHSKNTTDKKIMVDIVIKTWGDSILFSVKNSFSNIRPQTNSIKNDSGLGLANALKRLRLLYPDEHNLNVKEEEGIFSVMLQLKVK